MQFTEEQITEELVEISASIHAYSVCQVQIHEGEESRTLAKDRLAHQLRVSVHKYILSRIPELMCTIHMKDWAKASKIVEEIENYILKESL